jgi:hypothetical protein
MSKAPDHKYSGIETAARRDPVLKRMLNMPPKPHLKMKIGKPKTTTAKRKSKS